MRERVQLLDPDDGHRGLTLVALGHRVPRHLAGAEHDPPHGVGVGHERVVEHLLERAGGQLVDRRPGLLHAQWLLRREHDRAACAARVRTWRRSRWKYCAAVVALKTWMLSSAHRVRNRSMRAELCSGPWPS